MKRLIFAVLFFGVFGVSCADTQLSANNGNPQIAEDSDIDLDANPQINRFNETFVENEELGQDLEEETEVTVESVEDSGLHTNGLNKIIYPSLINSNPDLLTDPYTITPDGIVEDGDSNELNESDLSDLLTLFAGQTGDRCTNSNQLLTLPNVTQDQHHRIFSGTFTEQELTNIVGFWSEIRVAANGIKDNQGREYHSFAKINDINYSSFSENSFVGDDSFLFYKRTGNYSTHAAFPNDRVQTGSGYKKLTFPVYIEIKEPLFLGSSQLVGSARLIRTCR